MTNLASRRTLRLRRERLVELTNEELAVLQAGKPVSEGVGCRPFTDLSRCRITTLLGC